MNNNFVFYLNCYTAVIGTIALIVAIAVYISNRSVKKIKMQLSGSLNKITETHRIVNDVIGFVRDISNKVVGQPSQYRGNNNRGYQPNNDGRRRDGRSYQNRDGRDNFADRNRRYGGEGAPVENGEFPTGDTRPRYDRQDYKPDVAGTRDMIKSATSTGLDKKSRPVAESFDEFVPGTRDSDYHDDNIGVDGK